MDHLPQTAREGSGPEEDILSALVERVGEVTTCPSWNSSPSASVSIIFTYVKERILGTLERID